MPTIIISGSPDREWLPIFLFGFICIFQIAYEKPKLFLDVEKADGIFNRLIIENLENRKYFIEENC